jgi:hypothetical protein
MKYKHTTKLFWDKFKYKLDVRTPVSFIFRNKKLEYARSKIDDIINSKEGNSYYLKVRLHGKPLTTFEVEDLKLLLNYFTSADLEYTLRCEGNHLGVFSNNIEWLEQLGDKLHQTCTLFMPPNDVDLTVNTIVNDDPRWAYKITLNGTADPNLAEFCKKNPTKVRIGNAVLNDIQRGYNLKGRYIFVKDEQTFTLISLFLNKNVLRKDKLVSIEKTDK